DDEEAAVFRLHGGKLRLEQLELLLRPTSTRFKSQSVVASVGEGSCVFERCVITLEAAAQGVPLNVLTVADLSGVMKMDPQPAQPTGGPASCTLSKCFVRGDGDLIAARSGRSLALKAEQTLVALSGSFLNREAAADEMLPSVAATDSLDLTHVTTYLGG